MDAQLRRNKSEGRIELPSLYQNASKQLKTIIQSTSKNEDITQKAQNDVKRKIITNANNEIGYYDIPNFQESWNKKKDVNFKSIYLLSDLQLLRGTNYYSRIKNEFEVAEKKKQFSLTDKVEHEIKLKKDATILEKKIRKKIRNQEGQILLLGEIYDMLDENIDQQTVVSKTKQAYLNRQQNEKKHELLDHLDSFHKKIKQEKEQQRKIMQSKLEQQKLQQLQGQQHQMSESNKSTPRQQAYKGLDRRQSLLNIVKQNISIQRKASSDSHDLGSQRNKNQSLPALSKKPSKQLSQFLNQQSTLSQQERNEEQERNDFVNQFKDAFQQVKTDKDKNSSMDLKDNDRATRKKLVKYIKGGVNVDGSSGDDNLIEENLKFDSTPEGIKLNLDVIYSNSQVATYNSVVQKSNFFEKQSNIFEQRLNSMIANTEAFINSKENTLRIIRQENHVISNKMTEIRNYKQMLRDKKKELENEIRDSSPKHLANNKIINISTKNLKDSIRHNAINSIMQREEKLREIDDQVDILKDNYMKFEDKTEYNGKLLQEIEEIINEKRKDFKLQLKTQKQLYTELLNRGFDIRDEGLSWIIIKLWSLDELVQKIDLPSFLDDKAKDYLLNKAQKLQELRENQTLLNVYLDMYKTNLKTVAQQNQELIEENDSDDTENNNFGGNDSLEYRNSTINKDQNATQNMNSTVPSMINNQSALQLSMTSQNQNNLSYVDVQFAREREMRQTKKKHIQNVERLYQGMETQVQEISNNTINELSQTKLTTANLIYEETQKKIKNNVKNWIDQERVESRSLNQDQNSSIDDIPFQPLVHKIDLFDNGAHINPHNNRQEFIEDYRNLQNNIKEQKHIIKQQDDQEVQRIIKEFDYKQYAKKYNTNCAIVLGAIFGSSYADKLIIRYGMAKK